MIISIRCDHSSAPGIGWRIYVEFRSIRRGFSVWCYAENVNEDSPRWRKVGEIKKQISWREVCQFLLSSEELHVFGDLFSDVIVAGLASPYDELVKAVFIIDEDGPIQFEKVVQLMMGFSDQELDKLHQDLGGILSSCSASVDEGAKSAYDGLYSLAKLANEHQILGKSLAEIKVWARLESDASIETVVGALRSRRQRKSRGPAPVKPVKPVKATKAESLSEPMEGPSPKEPAEVARLLYSWIVTDTKPIEGRIGNFSVSGVELPYLLWLLKSGITEPLFLLGKKHPSQAGAFVAWIISKRKRSADRLEGPGRITGGGVLGHQMGTILHRSWIEFCAQALASAKELGLYDGDPNLVVYYVYSTKNNNWEISPKWRKDGAFNSEIRAIKAAKQVIIRSLQEIYRPTMSAKQLKAAFCKTGREVSIYSVVPSSFNSIQCAWQCALEIASGKV